MKKLILIGLLSVLVTGCVFTNSPVGDGAIFTDVRHPLMVGESTDTTKSAQACAVNVLGLIAAGDASIEKAKAVGGITNVASVDYRAVKFLMLFSQVCTIVTGS